MAPRADIPDPMKPGLWRIEPALPIALDNRGKKSFDDKALVELDRRVDAVRQAAR